MATNAQQAAWQNDRRWRGRWLGIHCAAGDPRLIASRRSPAVGWTLGFANRASWIILASRLGAGAVVAVLAPVRP